MRLKIAKDLANALVYLHTAFPRPNLHLNIGPHSVLFDKDSHVAKLANFDMSVLIPQLETVAHHDNYSEVQFWDLHGSNLMILLGPEEFMMTGVNEQTDVYAFGVLLLVLLTGKNASYRAYEMRTFLIADAFALPTDRMVDPRILEDQGDVINGDHQLQFQAFHQLTKSCLSISRAARPLMIDVAKELTKIEKITDCTAITA